MSSILGNITDPFGLNFIKLSDIYGIVLNVLLGASLTIGTIAIIVSGIQFILSEGDPKAIDTAKKYLTVSVVAIVIALMAFAAKAILVGMVGGVINDVPDF